MKSLLLAATVAAGFLLTTSTADAQYRYRRGAAYGTPSYSTYSYPTYSGSYYTPTYTTNGEVITSSYYTPTYTYPSSGTVIQSGYTPSYTYPTYYNNGYNINSYYNNGYYNNGINLTPSGVNYGNRRIWRW